jgi:hypothetical protein
VVGIDERPDGIVPKIISGGLFYGMPQQHAGNGKELQEIQVRNSSFLYAFHDLSLFYLCEDKYFL